MLRIFAMYNNLSDRYKGLLLTASGVVVLLLLAFGALQQLLVYIAVAGAIGMIGLGLFKLEVYKKVKEFLEKKEQQQK